MPIDLNKPEFAVYAIRGGIVVPCHAKRIAVRRVKNAEREDRFRVEFEHEFATGAPSLVGTYESRDEAETVCLRLQAVYL